MQREYTFEEYKNEVFIQEPHLKELYDQELLNAFIGNEVRKIRLKKGISQQDLAEKIHSTQSVIARIEGGKSNISMKTLGKLASGLGAKIELVG